MALMFSEKQQFREFGRVPKTLHIVSQWGFWRQNMSLHVVKNDFSENNVFNLACRIILSVFLFYIIFKQIWAWHRNQVHCRLPWWHTIKWYKNLNEKVHLFFIIQVQISIGRQGAFNPQVVNHVNAYDELKVEDLAVINI